ncbi:MAG: YdeI/OmpD-associated family protein [Bacteroidota bacterium]
MRIKADEPLWLIQVPDGYKHLFADVELKTSLPAKGGVSQLVFFAIDKKTIDANMERIVAKLQEGALFWILYPKKSGSINSHMSRDESWEIAKNVGYAPVTSSAIDNDWTALRFKKKSHIKNALRNTPIEQREVEGIDFKNRTVVLPADALKAMKPHNGMVDYFYGLAFTHKKEHLVAIADAKKTETRQRRIEKMIEMLGQKMQLKNLKK